MKINTFPLKMVLYYIDVLIFSSIPILHIFLRKQIIKKDSDISTIKCIHLFRTENAVLSAESQL